MEPTLSDHLKNYISEGQSDLLHEGLNLLRNARADTQGNFKDYSFVVFPFAKAYEGFLKQVFLDAHYITRRDYYSQYFRIGKVLSPNLVRRLGNQSVYKKIHDRHGAELSEKIWQTWKKGRNEVFHYFPHNLHSLTFNEAEKIVLNILQTMESAVSVMRLKHVQDQLLRYDVIGP